MNKLFVLFVFIACLAGPGCKNNTSATTEATASESPENKSTSAQYESIPQDLVMKVWNEVDMLDYIFHDLPFSMSQNDQASIRTNVTYIGKDAQPDIPTDCRPIARQFYQTEGDIFLEADIYFDAKCKFYVFFIEGKPRYANKMSPEGVSFFQTMIKQALNASQGIGQ
jgi:hypothetical protein